MVWVLNEWSDQHSFLTSAADFLPALRQVPVFPMSWGLILSPCVEPGIQVLL